MVQQLVLYHAEPVDWRWNEEKGKAEITVRSPPKEIKTNLPSNFSQAERMAAEKFDLQMGSFGLKDDYGKMQSDEDLYRLLHNAKSKDLHITVQQHDHFIRLAALEFHSKRQDAKIKDLENCLGTSGGEMDQKIDAVREEALAANRRLEGRVDNEVLPVTSALMSDKNRLQKDVRVIEEKISELDINEMKEIAEATKSLRDEVGDAVRKTNAMQAAWQADKQRLDQTSMQCQQDLHELQRYLQGKIDVCIEADADLRRENTLCNERMLIVADDLRLLNSEHSRLMRQITGALEESEELRTLLGQLREDNEHLRSDHGNVKTRVHCIEGQAKEVWKGFTPGVLYFRQWHKTAKGGDVQQSKDMQTCTGRGFMAVTGLVVGNIEGLCVADGPCRRFGTPGLYSSYFELEMVEVKTVPDGMGGLYVGMSLQSSEEIARHPQKEFDGWMIGGNCKALVCRAGTPPDMPVDPKRVPGTFAAGLSEDSMADIEDAMALLRKALPPRPKGDMRDFGSSWDSQHLRPGDRVGVLFRCNRDVGARLRVSVNGVVVATQEFVDAPTAEAVGLFTPLIRIAGSAKSVKILPGLTPPSAMLAG